MRALPPSCLFCGLNRCGCDPCLNDCCDWPTKLLSADKLLSVCPLMSKGREGKTQRESGPLSSSVLIESNLRKRVAFILLDNIDRHPSCVRKRERHASSSTVLLLTAKSKQCAEITYY